MGLGRGFYALLEETTDGYVGCLMEKIGLTMGCSIRGSGTSV